MILTLVPQHTIAWRNMERLQAQVHNFGIFPDEGKKLPMVAQWEGNIVSVGQNQNLIVALFGLRMFY